MKMARDHLAEEQDRSAIEEKISALTQMIGSDGWRIFSEAVRERSDILTTMIVGREINSETWPEVRAMQRERRILLSVLNMPQDVIYNFEQTLITPPREEAQ